MNLKFVSAQPDVPYFHWQTEVYIENFINKGIKPEQIHVVFGLWNTDIPNDRPKKLSEKGVNVHFYKDERTSKNYIPSVKPYLISKWLEEYPENGDVFFLHDSDIIFRELPDYSKYINDDICYVADTISYIGYDYLKSCCERYELKHPQSEKFELLKNMTNVLGIEIECLIKNQNNSGGGQYIIKNTNKDDWNKMYLDSIEIYNTMMNYQKKYPINPGQIQFWTAEMWSLLWNLWCLNKETKVIDDLNFSNATDDIDIYEKKPILHMAGVLDSMKHKKFYKGDYINQDPLQLLKSNINHFDFIEKNSATIKYVDVMKSLVQKS
jgi:hypothetical protein